jgi:Recombination endonuclease VII
MIKRCSLCGVEKSLDEFHRRAGTKDGHQTRCKVCAIAVSCAHYAANRSDILARAAKKYANDPDAGRKRLAKSKGYTLAEYDEMLARGCAICGTHTNPTRGRRMSLDHDHKTGKHRDILCSHCNVGLGNFHDEPARLRAAADYLERHAAE